MADEIVNVNGWYVTRQEIEALQDRQRENYGRRDQGGERFVRVRLAVEGIAVAVQKRMGASELGFWRAELGRDRGVNLVRWEGGDMDGRLYLDERSFEVIGELTGKTGRRWGEQDLGSTVDEQRDTLYEVVQMAARSAESPAQDAPEHRKPHIDEGSDGRPWPSPTRGDDAWNRAATIEQHLFSNDVGSVWVKANFARVLDDLRQPHHLLSHLSDRAFKKLAGSAPLEPLSRHSTEQRLADGEIGPRAAKARLKPPKTLELTRIEQGMRGFLDDMADRAGVDRDEFLNLVTAAPPAQKAWQIAGSLLSAGPQLAAGEYPEAREKLSVAIDRAVRALNGTNSYRDVSDRVFRAAEALQGISETAEVSTEAQPPAPSLTESQAQVLPQTGVAQSRPEAPATGRPVVRGGFGLPAAVQTRRGELTAAEVTAAQPPPGSRPLTPERTREFAEQWRKTARRTGPATERPGSTPARGAD